MDCQTRKRYAIGKVGSGWRTYVKQTPTGTAAAMPRVLLDSVAISRLMDEVRNGQDRQSSAYNRMHNRHNR